MSGSPESVTQQELNHAREKLLRAKRRNTKFSQAEQDIDKEEERLEEQKRCLVTKRLMLHGQYKDWLNNTVTSRIIIPYCKAWNRNFAAELQARLPREVRDMAYKYLWHFDPDRTSPHLMGRLHVLQHYTFTCGFCTPDTIAKFPILMDIAQSLLHVHPDELGRLVDRSLLPHYLSSDYVGVLTAHEIGVSFYASISAEHLLQCQSNDIHSVLNKDALHLGLPTMNLITSLTVHCKIDRYRTPRPDHKLSSKCNHSMSEAEQIRGDVLQDDFCALLDINKKKGFRLHVIMYQRNIRVTVLEEALEALTMVFHIFQQNEASLKITWTYRGHWKNSIGPPCHDLLAFDITPESDALEEPVLDPDRKGRLLKMLYQADDIILPRHFRFDDERTYNLSTLDRKRINRLVHSMYDLDEDADTTDGEDIFSDPDSDSDDDHECGFVIAASDDDDGDEF